MNKFVRLHAPTQRARAPLKRAQGVLVAAARAPREQQRAVGREGESTDRALEAWLWAITASLGLNWGMKTGSVNCTCQKTRGVLNESPTDLVSSPC